MRRKHKIRCFFGIHEWCLTIILTDLRFCFNRCNHCGKEQL